MGPDLDQNDPRIGLYIAQRGMNPDTAGVKAAKKSHPDPVPSGFDSDAHKCYKCDSLWHLKGLSLPSSRPFLSQSLGLPMSVTYEFTIAEQQHHSSITAFLF